MSVTGPELTNVVRQALDTVYADWVREELDLRLRGHLEQMVETAKDEATKAIAAKLLALVIRETTDAVR